jgi:hypothetical protein
MPLSEKDRERIESFRGYVEDTVAADDRYGPKQRLDREDGSTLATRFSAGPKCWFEVAIRPFIPQVRVGFLTEDRWKSEECEEAIQDSGDTMQEFVGMGMQDAGLDWSEPPVEHYREAGQYFYFATPLALDSLEDLEMDEVRDKTVRMLEGYFIAFGPAIAVEDGED